VPLLRSSLPVFTLWVVSVGALAAAQFVVAPGQSREPVQQPTERRVPVGTSSISGTIVTADTGRPIRGARVTVSGLVPANMAASVGGRSGPPDRPPVAVGLLADGFSLADAVQVNAILGTPTSSLSRTVYTDATGQFSFPRMPAGNFGVSVLQSQFLPVNYGQRRMGGPGRAMALADGQQLTLKIPMLRGGVITGTVLGADGEPQGNAQVRGFRYDMNSGFKRLQSVAFAQADDRGVYRMFGLQPGDYVVSATPNASDAMNADRQAQEADFVERAIVSGQVKPPTAPGFTPTVVVPFSPPPMSPGQMQLMNQQQYLPTYAPSSPAPSGATKVTIAGGEERAGVDILVRLTLATNIQGVLTTPLDTGVAVQMTLISDDPTIDSPQTSSTRVDQNGKFMFRTVAPGKYTLFAQTIPGQPPMTLINGQMAGAPSQPIVLTDAQKMWGKARVTVAGEPQIDVSVSLEPSRSISGIVVFDMAKQPDLARARMTVSLSWAPSPQTMSFGRQPQTQVGPDGRFTLTGVVPGRMTIRGDGYLLKSAVVGGQDTLDFPLEFTGERDVTDAVLTFTDTFSELSGTITDPAGKPADDVIIVVAASDNRYWTPGSRRIVIARPTPDGRYMIRSLPPGAYVIAAVTDLENGGQYDPEFLRTLSAVSVPVTIMEGGKVTQDLRVK